MKKLDTRSMVQISFLVAISAVLYFFEIPVFPPLKVDLSDLPVLVGGSLMGPVAGFLIALLKNVVHIIFISKDGSVAGEIANFLYSILILIPAVYGIRKKKYQTIVCLAVGVVAAALVMNVLNYYITFPLYGLSKEGAWTILNATYLPFNLVKGTILLSIFFIIQPFIHKTIR